MRLRVVLSRVVLGALTVFAAVMSTLSFDWGRAEEPRYRPNALLIGASLRDVRRPATARFAELIGTDPVSLYLFGCRVTVDVRGDVMHLVDQAGSAVDTLVWVSGRPRRVASGRWADRGPTMGLYFRHRP